MNLVVKMKFGSHLYGTATENSDLDYKGVFMPDMNDILLGRVPKSYNTTTGGNNSKNTADDVDTEIYSLHYFIKLACEGQTVALDMLYTPQEMIIESSRIWDLIVDRREHFHTKSLNAFVGYARRQASKYGLRSGRLGNVEQVIKVLEKYKDK